MKRLRPKRTLPPATKPSARAFEWTAVVASLLIAAVGPLHAQTPAGGLDCMIQPHETVQIGTAAAGVVQTMHVERGDVVRRGQALVQMNAEVERAALAVARERASQTGELVAARGANELAVREAQRAAELVRENFVSHTYFDRQRAEATMADGRGQQAEEKRKLAQREVQLASAQLSLRTVVSPIDGVVVERYVSPGEYVEQKPVLRIAAIDPLRVDVLVPAGAFGQVSVGAKASVVPELLNRTPHTGTVTSVDRVIDAASNTFRVRLVLPNPGGALPPGLRCKADLGLRAEPAPRNGSAIVPAAQRSVSAPAPVMAPVSVPASALAPAAVPTPMPTAESPAPQRMPPPVPTAIEPAAMQAAAVAAVPPASAHIVRVIDNAIAAWPVAVTPVTRMAGDIPPPATPRLKMAPIEYVPALAQLTPPR